MAQQKAGSNHDPPRSNGVRRSSRNVAGAAQEAVAQMRALGIRVELTRGDWLVFELEDLLIDHRAVQILDRVWPGWRDCVTSRRRCSLWSAVSHRPESLHNARRSWRVPLWLTRLAARAAATVMMTEVQRVPPRSAYATAGPSAGRAVESHSARPVGGAVALARSVRRGERCRRGSAPPP